MYWKFYKLLIIGNPQATILHIPDRNNGTAWVHGCMDVSIMPHATCHMQSCSHAIPIAERSATKFQFVLRSSRPHLVDVFPNSLKKLIRCNRKYRIAYI
jgi:hypothetical protein